MIKLISLVFFTLSSFIMGAQISFDGAFIPKDVLKSLEKNYDEKLSIYKDNNNQIKTNGFRVLIISTTNREQAEKISKELENLSEFKTYLLYEQPYFKVKVGDFHYKYNATELELKLKDSYENCKVVPDKIQFNLKE